MKEIWKDIPGYEGLYKVSNLGRIRSLNHIARYRNKYGGVSVCEIKGVIKRPSQSGNGYKKGNGYLSVTLSKDGVSERMNVHRIVATVFIPNPGNKPQVNHLDGNKSNNRVDNLEWCTAEENMRHCTHITKTLHSMYAPVRTLCVEMNKVYVSTSEAARDMGLNRRALSSAIQRNRMYGGYHWRKV